MAFGVDIVRSIRFHKKLALTFQMKLIHSGGDVNSEVTNPREYCETQGIAKAKSGSKYMESDTNQKRNRGEVTYE